VSGPVPLHRYRTFRRGKAAERADRIHALARHPKLRNDLRRPTMEKIGYRTDIFTLDGITGSQREYIQWLLKTSTGKGKPEDILTTEAVDLLAMKLRTPLQVQLHLTLAMEAGYQTGEKL